MAPVRVSAVVVVVAATVVVMVACGTPPAGDPKPKGEHHSATESQQSPRLLAMRERYYNLSINTRGCLPPLDPADPDELPKMPNSYMTKVEIVLEKFFGIDVKRVIKGVEMYDSSSQSGVREYEIKEGIFLLQPHVKKVSMHFNNFFNDVIFIYLDDPCSVTGEENCPLQKRCVGSKIRDLDPTLQELFGIVDRGDGGEFMGSMGLLQFGPDFPYEFSGEEDCRGARCYMYEACLDKPNLGGSIILTYSWATEDWDMQNNDNKVPISVDVFGVLSVEGGNQEIMFTINFFDFRREWMPSLDELEAPVDVYCYNRQTPITISPPRPVVRYRITSELVLSGPNIPIFGNMTNLDKYSIVFPQKEWYDWEKKVSRKDFIPIFHFSAARRFENLTQKFYDFATGVTYVLKPRLDDCVIKRIEDDIGVVVGPDGSAHMESPWNIEDLDEPLQYNGLHWERGLRTDVWAGRKTDRINGRNETIVWYFASWLFTGEILGRSSDARISLPTLSTIPVKVEKYLTQAVRLAHATFNIYNYEAKVPDTHNHDVSICFGSDQKRHFTFDLPADTLNKSRYLRENLKYGIQSALCDAGHVPPLRINRVEITQTPTVLQVLFTLLEKPSLVASIEEDGEAYTLDEAAAAIRETIDSSQLNIMVKKDDHVRPVKGENQRWEEVTRVTALPSTMVEVSRGDGLPVGVENLTGYSPGDMAGLGIGMVVVGSLVGFGIMYMVVNKK